MDFLYRNNYQSKDSNNNLEFNWKSRLKSVYRLFDPCFGHRFVKPAMAGFFLTINLLLC